MLQVKGRESLKKAAFQLSGHKLPYNKTCLSTWRSINLHFMNSLQLQHFHPKIEHLSLGLGHNRNNRGRCLRCGIDRWLRQPLEIMAIAMTTTLPTTRVRRWHTIFMAAGKFPTCTMFRPIYHENLCKLLSTIFLPQRNNNNNNKMRVFHIYKYE